MAEQPKLKVQQQDAKDFVSVYANQVHWAISPVELILTFAQMVDADAEKRTVTMERRARVTLHPMQAILIRDAMTAALASHEKQYGSKLEVPKGIIVNPPDIKTVQ